MENKLWIVKDLIETYINIEFIFVDDGSIDNTNYNELSFQKII